MAERRERGRPTVYDPNLNDKVTKFCKLGATDEELADFLEVSLSTIYDWKNRHPEFLEAINKGKIHADMEVAEALHKKATGFTRNEVKIFQFQGSPVVIPFVAYYPPDTAAAFIWLKNRKAGAWKDKREVDQNLKATGITLDLGGGNIEEIERED